MFSFTKVCTRREPDEFSQVRKVAKWHKGNQNHPRQNNSYIKYTVHQYSLGEGSKRKKPNLYVHEKKNKTRTVCNGLTIILWSCKSCWRLI